MTLSRLQTSRKEKERIHGKDHNLEPEQAGAQALFLPLRDVPQTLSQVVYNEEKTNQFHRHFTYIQFTMSSFVVLRFSIPISDLFLQYLFAKEEDWNRNAASTFWFFLSVSLML